MRVGYEVCTLLCARAYGTVVSKTTKLRDYQLKGEQFSSQNLSISKLFKFLNPWHLSTEKIFYVTYLTTIY